MIYEKLILIYCLLLKLRSIAFENPPFNAFKLNYEDLLVAACVLSQESDSNDIERNILDVEQNGAPTSKFHVKVIHSLLSNNPISETKVSRDGYEVIVTGKGTNNLSVKDFHEESSNATLMTEISLCSSKLVRHELISKSEFDLVTLIPHHLNDKIVKALLQKHLNTTSLQADCNMWLYEAVMEKDFFGVKEMRLIFIASRRTFWDDGKSFIVKYFNDRNPDASDIDTNFGSKISCLCFNSTDTESDNNSRNLSLRRLDNIISSLRGNVLNILQLERDIIEVSVMLPNEPSIANLLGALSFSKQDLPAAAVHFRKAIELGDYKSSQFVRNYITCCIEIDEENVLNAIRRSFNFTKDVSVLRSAVHYFETRRNAVAMWEWIEIGLRTSHSDFDVWTLFADFAITMKQVRIGKEIWKLPDIPATDWRKYANAGLSLFPSCPALLYLRAMAYFEEGDLPCAARLLSESLSFQSLAKSDLVKSLFADGVIEQNYEWISSELRKGDASLVVNGSLSTAFLSHLQASCFPLRRIWPSSSSSSSSGSRSGSGRHPAHETALREAAEVLGLTAGEIDCPFLSEAVEGGCVALQVGCSDHTVCAKLPWMVLDLVPSLSTGIVSSATDLRQVRSASVHVLYCSHILEHLRHYGRNIATSFSSDLPMKEEIEASSGMVLDSGPEPPQEQERGTGKEKKSEVIEALKEWNRVLVPGGWLLLAVPDLHAIAAMYATKNLTREAKYHLAGIIYGGQNDPYNFHHTAFNFHFLEDILKATNFCDIEKRDAFGLFEDATTMNFYGFGSISLNVVARKCPKGMRKQFNLFY